MHRKGRTALFYTMRCNCPNHSKQECPHYEIADLLLDEEWSPNIIDKKGITPLMLAASDVIKQTKLIIDKGKYKYYEETHRKRSLCEC